MRLSQRISLIIAVLVFLTALQPFSTLRNIGRSWSKVLKEIRTTSLLGDVQRPRSGEAEALPKKVLVMIGLLRDHGVAAYRYTPESSEHDQQALLEERQRLTEGAYPALLDQHAPFLIQYASDPLPRGCAEKAARGGIVLAHCP